MFICSENNISVGQNISVKVFQIPNTKKVFQIHFNKKVFFISRYLNYSFNFKILSVIFYFNFKNKTKYIKYIFLRSISFTCIKKKSTPARSGKYIAPRINLNYARARATYAKLAAPQSQLHNQENFCTPYSHISIFV